MLKCFQIYLICILILPFSCTQYKEPSFRVIAFFSAKDDQAHVSFVHEANQWFSEMALKHNFVYDSTKDWNNLNPEYLSGYQVVIFLDSRPDSSEQRDAFRKYMESGGAWMGFHFAAFSLTPSAYPQNWDWYHDQFQGCGEYKGNTWRPTSAVLRVENPAHPATRHLPETFVASPNEWYKWENDLRTNPDIKILLSIDPASFPLGTGPKPYEIWHEGYYPVVWTNKNYKMVYINMGHNDIDYENNSDKELSFTFGNKIQDQLILNSLVWLGRNPPPVKIILDTDIAPDYDDVGALAMLHAFAEKGEAEILATVSSNAFRTTAPTLSVINTYFKRPDIPIGVLKDTQPNYECPRLYAEGIIAKYAHPIKSNEEAMDAVKLYRKVLSSQPDTSVTIVTIGYLTNLANLLNSEPDDYSPLDGEMLVKKKVKRLVSMACSIDSNGNSGYEWNILADIPSSQKVFNDWPTTITLSGFEIGVNIFTGMKLINNASIQNSPVKDAYQISIAYDGTEVGRYSWDQTAVLVAVRGIAPFFDSHKLNLTIKDDGKDTIIVGDRITYLISKQKPEQVETIIEELMMEVPR